MKNVELHHACFHEPTLAQNKGVLIRFDVSNQRMPELVISRMLLAGIQAEFGIAPEKNSGDDLNVSKHRELRGEQ